MLLRFYFTSEYPAFVFVGSKCVVRTYLRKIVYDNTGIVTSKSGMISEDWAAQLISFKMS